MGGTGNKLRSFSTSVSKAHGEKEEGSRLERAHGAQDGGADARHASGRGAEGGRHASPRGAEGRHVSPRRAEGRRGAADRPRRDRAPRVREVRRARLWPRTRGDRLARGRSRAPRSKELIQPTRSEGDAKATRAGWYPRRGGRPSSRPDRTHRPRRVWRERRTKAGPVVRRADEALMRRRRSRCRARSRIADGGAAGIGRYELGTVRPAPWR